MFRTKKRKEAAKMPIERTKPLLGDKDVGASLQVRACPGIAGVDTIYPLASTVPAPVDAWNVLHDF